MNEVRRIVVDTDPGIDDLYAILIFLEAEKLNLIKIEAFTVTAGNTDVENSCKNLVSLLERANRTDIPIYKGASRNILSQQHTFEHFGDNGVGNFVYPAEPDVSIIRHTPSAIALKEIVEENPGEITLVCLAPLTNIALAYKIYEDIFNNLKEIFIMGGTCRARGNVTICAEFNFYFDPESVYIFLQNVTCPTTILPYEPCLDAQLETNWRFGVLLNNTPELQFLTQMDKHHHTVTKKRNKDKWMQPDIYLAAMILCPDLVVRKNLYHMTIELHGGLTRGQCIFNHTKENDPNVLIVEEISKEIFVETLLKIYKIDR